MGNYEAVAYAVIALKQLQQEVKEINEESLSGRMLYLMDMYSENEIYTKYSNGDYK
ncbi:MAG: hypothetical protein JXR64_14105 [Spirochaetales bacterium]|nr:hypothetical protein [Spirochaetales bacterium]